MTRSLMRWITSLVAMLVGARLLGAQVDSTKGDSAVLAEARYAQLITGLADSAIRQLDLLSPVAQARVQTAFLDSTNARGIPFGALARRSSVAAEAVAEIGDRFTTNAPPDDLVLLHDALGTALRDAQAALGRLAATATACQGSEMSLQRCQVPFADAATRVSQVYRRYLEARDRIKRQITDTGTFLPPFHRSS